MNRLQQGAQASSEDLDKLSEELKQLQDQHEDHKTIAQEGHTYHLDLLKRCSEQWDKITSLAQKEMLTKEEEQTLCDLKNQFTVVLCADHQMAKLVPYWGMSAQPGSTYYLQKLSNDLFGIVDHSSGSSTVYMFDERAGPKNTDHTISYLTNFISTLPVWVRRVHIFLDNTCSTNKNYFLMAWAHEMVLQDQLNFYESPFSSQGLLNFLLTSFSAKSHSHTTKVMYLALMA